VPAVAERAKLIWSVGPKAGLEADLSLAWTKYIPLKPTPKQLSFLLIPTLEAFYGGAGGGGKSICLLMASLQYADTPGYNALILRKSFADLALPGALMDMAESWLVNTDARWDGINKVWGFPSGATLSFGYLDHSKDKYRYSSAAFSFIAFDELSAFSLDDYLFMFSRLRRDSRHKVPLRMRSASNPGNIGHQWIKDRFLDNPDPNRIFIRAGLSDNPYLDIEEYRKSLAELDPITRRQIEDGDWTARHGGSKFKRESFEIVDAAPIEATKVRRWDFAATQPKAGKDPDWTVGLKLAKSKDGILYIEDIVRLRGTPLSVEQAVRQTAELDGKGVMIRAEQEPGSSGVMTMSDLQRRVLFGYDFKGVLSTGSKEVRANPAASMAEAGNIKLVNGRWIRAFLDEAELFPSGAHDDQIDALSGAITDLTNPWRPLMIG